MHTHTQPTLKTDTHKTYRQKQKNVQHITQETQRLHMIWEEKVTN